MKNFMSPPLKLIFYYKQKQFFAGTSVSLANVRLLALKSPMTILDRILSKKKERLASAKFRISLSEMKSAVKEIEAPRDFITAISGDGNGIRLIAEIKKASPSKGLIRPDFDHKEIAAVYHSNKVDSISVLTEEDFFQGSPEFIKDVKNIAACPVLRKDFIFDEYQLYETRASKADAVLLIAAILQRNQAEEYLCHARELGLSVLFEVHNFEELETALRIQAPVIGINNRNLKTLAIDLNTTFELKKQIPADRVIVSESGIKSREDVLKLEEAGIDAMLIGTSLMESGDIEGKIRVLRGIG
jgi:indole-3-glycerol phosphate synthase